MRNQTAGRQQAGTREVSDHLQDLGGVLARPAGVILGSPRRTRAAVNDRVANARARRVGNSRIDEDHSSYFKNEQKHEHRHNRHDAEFHEALPPPPLVFSAASVH